MYCLHVIQKLSAIIGGGRGWLKRQKFGRDTAEDIERKGVYQVGREGG
jgi:hypothetical protein